ncbi:hypothetical protein L218DRAFT_951481 [Marasmius fiardii PR-910]|nr:hypothetical protein L218DRAFT_951481 [Marasmius fiardii PR-910]
MSLSKGSTFWTCSGIFLRLGGPENFLSNSHGRIDFDRKSFAKVEPSGILGNRNQSEGNATFRDQGRGLNVVGKLGFPSYKQRDVEQGAISMLVLADKTRDLEIRKRVSTCSGWGFELAIIILESGEHWKIISKNLFTFGFRPRNIQTSKLMMEELLRCSDNQGPGCSAIFNSAVAALSTNYPPFPSHLVVTGNASLDSEIEQPEDTLMKAWIVTGSLERGPRFLKAASHPVRLPNEILADIFESGVAAENLVEPDYPPRSLDTRSLTEIFTFPGPAPLKGPFDSTGFPVGCKSACIANLDGNPQNPANCCSGSHNTPATCPASGQQASFAINFDDVDDKEDGMLDAEQQEVTYGTCIVCQENLSQSKSFGTILKSKPDPQLESLQFRNGTGEFVFWSVQDPAYTSIFRNQEKVDGSDPMKMVGTVMAVSKSLSQQTRHLRDRNEPEPGERGAGIYLPEELIGYSISCIEIALRGVESRGDASGGLLLERWVVLYLYGNSGSFTQPPYLDVHGEIDVLMRRGRRECLHHARWEDVRKTWLNHQIPTVIAMKLESSLDLGGWETL